MCGAAPKDRVEYDARIIAGADYFTATIFLGSARFDTVRDLPNVEAARTAAKGLLVKHQNGRPSAIYAVKNGLTAHVENVAR